MNEEQFLKEYDRSAYDSPSVATDIVLFTLNHPRRAGKTKKILLGPLQLLLIQRATFPERGKWVLPGGFCRKEETFFETAERELRMETGVERAFLKEFGTFSSANRDPRGWIVSDAFLGIINKEDCVLRTDAEAWEAQWFDVSLTEERKILDRTEHVVKTQYVYDLTLKNEDLTLRAQVKKTKRLDGVRSTYQWEIITSDLGFDHAHMVVQLLLDLRQGIRDDIAMVFEFLPETFTIGEIETAMKSIFQIQERIPNFRRRILPYVKETGEVSDATCRTAQMYRRNLEVF